MVYLFIYRLRYDTLKLQNNNYNKEKTVLLKTFFGAKTSDMLHTHKEQYLHQYLLKNKQQKKQY